LSLPRCGGSGPAACPRNEGVSGWCGQASFGLAINNCAPLDRYCSQNECRTINPNSPSGEAFDRYRKVF
jgi:hypothetical protein